MILCDCCEEFTLFTQVSHKKGMELQIIDFT